MRKRVLALAWRGPVSVLEIGPGTGARGRALAGAGVGRLIALEISAKNVEKNRLCEIYDEVLVGDAWKLAWPAVDVVILGDLTEHLGARAAREMWDHAAAVARRAVYLVLSVDHDPRHLEEFARLPFHPGPGWDHLAVLGELPDIGDWWLGEEIGVYERRTDRARHPV
jgi:predicted TPR repeat methyltransferase